MSDLSTPGDHPMWNGRSGWWWQTSTERSDGALYRPWLRQRPIARRRGGPARGDPGHLTPVCSSPGRFTELEMERPRPCGRGLSGRCQRPCPSSKTRDWGLPWENRPAVASGDWLGMGVIGTLSRVSSHFIPVPAPRRSPGGAPLPTTYETYGVATTRGNSSGTVVTARCRRSTSRKPSGDFARAVSRAQDVARGSS